MEVIGNKYVTYEFGRFLLDPKERTLFADGIPVRIPAKEFDTLLLLVLHNGHALTKEEMLSAIWQDSFVEESSLAKQISRLRKIFNKDGEVVLETLPKHGYRFTANVRRAVVEPDDARIVGKRTVKRVTFSLEDDIASEQKVLPPVRRRVFTTGLILIMLVCAAVVGTLAWQFVLRPPATIDPYAPVRLTDNSLDDSNPAWTREGKILFARTFPDDHAELWIMGSDGSGQERVKMPDGRQIVSWSPDGQRIQFVKPDDERKFYVSNVDGSGERLLPFRGGGWSFDSKMITYHQRISGSDFDVFVYWIETGEVRDVTNAPSFDVDPAFSPDNGKLVFVSDRDGNPEIYSINIDGTNIRRLTFNEALDAHPCYSPDGTQILFGSLRENENGDAYLMNTDGSNVAKVTDWDKSNETVQPGSWSPDGTEIAFYTDRNGRDDIYVVSAETVRPKLLFSDPERNLVSLSYAPDGKRLVFTVEKEDKSGEMRILHSRSGETSFVRRTEVTQTAAHWSRDGESIVFRDRVAGNSEILTVKPDGSNLRNLTNDPAQDMTPSWSFDGAHIVFSTMRGGQSVAPRLYIMKADGTEQRPLTPRNGWESDPSWWPDGSRLVFACDREDSPGDMMDICQINEDGTGERRILFHRRYDTLPVVSPDGSRIAFTATSDGNAEIYLMNSDGSGLVRLTRNPADDTSPEWSPDGTRLAFLSNRGGKFAIYEIVF